MDVIIIRDPILYKQRGPAVGWDIQEEKLNLASHQSLALLARKYLTSSCHHHQFIYLSCLVHYGPSRHNSCVYVCVSL